MKLRWKILLIIPLVFLLIYPLLLRSESTVGLDANNCRVVREAYGQLVIDCSPSVLYTSSGLFIGLVPEEAHANGYNSVRFEEAYSLNYNENSILVTIFHDDNPHIEVILPPNKNYGGNYVVGWTLDVTIYEYDSAINQMVYSDDRTISLTGDYPQNGWIVTLNQNQYPVYFQLYPVTGQPPKPKPTWNPANDWFNFFNNLINTVSQGLDIAISIFTTVISYLLQIIPYIAIIIPLHIIFAFANSPTEGIAVINFYIGLARKLLDLVIQVVQVIVSLLDAIIPF